ncbi:hypothetical protein [uncultured Paraglaciecola sp.]|uniref:hypothetical protein n=1 Tax=uncultured Paraglaciecola sp. TaxID=1765024 RepID=UPI00262A0D5C|nr:hypothetical protein [uncultured Paraglaciecola sp.]
MTLLSINFTPSKLLNVLALAAVISGCSSTTDTSSQVIDEACQSQGQRMAQSAETSGANAQYLTAARTLQSCVLHPLPNHLTDKQSEVVMQLMANTTLNYVKGGDIAAAKIQLNEFELQFSDQDLYLADFTSFRDTANALLQGAELSSQELAGLNISRALRAELQRQKYWLTH